MVLLLCIGCTRINNNNYDVIVNDVIENSNNIYNTNSLGYKYYLPFSINKVYDKDYNQIFKVNDTYMYLYVDVISYYYKNNLNLDDKDSSDCYYYYKINNNNKNGYVKITKDKDKYFMKVVYNYAKIETYVEEYELADILSYSMIILNSINYNDNLIEKILQDDYYSSSFKEYKIKGLMLHDAKIECRQADADNVIHITDKSYDMVNNLKIYEYVVNLNTESFIQEK